MSCELDVRVTPRSRQNRVEVREEVVNVWVTAPPADGEANEAVTRLIAKTLGIAPSRVQVIRGASSRKKRLAIEGLDASEVWTKLT